MNSYTSYLNWIDSQENTLLQRLKRWVEINTFSTYIEGLERCLNLLKQDFTPLLADCFVTPLPPHPFLNAEGVFIKHPLGQALSLRKRPDAPIQILLGGHYDTVYPPTSSFQKMFEVQPGIWKGPGVADMKGGLAILLTSLEALERSPFAEKIGWEVLLTPDEELGSPGSSLLYQAAALRAHIGLIFEPAFPDGSFVKERKGSITLSAAFKGRAAHVGRDFPNGRSAVFTIARFINHVQQIEKGKDLTINIADLEGKGPVNIVPPLASCRINLRSSNLELLSTATQKVHQLAKFCCEQDGIEYELIEDSMRSPKPYDNKSKPLFDAYEGCAKELKIPFKLCSTGGVCDGNNLAGAGLPTLDTLGAIGGNLHTIEEYLLQSSLVERSKLTALFLFKLASGEITLEKAESL